MFRWSHQTVAAVAAAGILAVFAPAAEAGFTAVKQSKRKSEVSHEQILERVYGGDFVSDATGLNFSNNSGVTVTRVEDTADESWAGKSISARTVAASSKGRKTAGYFGTVAGGQVQKLAEKAGRQYSVAGGNAGVTSDGELIFSKGRGRRAQTFSSVASANSDGMDHMVTYEVKGASGQPASVYLLCWEDRFAGRRDRDYTDLVVEVQAAEALSRSAVSQPLLIPLPPAAWTGLSGLIALGVLARLRWRPIRFA